MRRGEISVLKGFPCPQFGSTFLYYSTCNPLQKQPLCFWYNQAVRVAIGVDVGVLGAEAEEIEEIIVVEGPRRSDKMVAVI